jgi:hypothetical protein
MEIIFHLTRDQVCNNSFASSTLLSLLPYFLLDLVSMEKPPEIIARYMQSPASQGRAEGHPIGLSTGSSAARAPLGSGCGLSLKQRLLMEKSSAHPCASRHTHFGGLLRVEAADGCLSVANPLMADGAPATATLRRDRRRLPFNASNTTAPKASTGQKAATVIAHFCNEFLKEAYQVDSSHRHPSRASFSRNFKLVLQFYFYKRLFRCSSVLDASAIFIEVLFIVYSTVIDSIEYCIENKNSGVHEEHQDRIPSRVLAVGYGG